MTMGLKLLRGYKSVNDITHLVLKNPVGSLFDVFLAKASDKIICPSPILAREIASYCFADEQKILVVPNGVDLRYFDGIESVDGSLLDKYGLQTNSFLLYMGRLSFLKGIQYLVEAFRIVKRQNSAIKLVIAGSGDFEPHLRELAGKEKDIVFLGYLSSMEIKKLLYEACLAVVLPSLLYEVAPMAILEGMACGRPILATDVGGNSFMVRHGENGFLSKPADPKNLAEYIRILCEDGALSRKMGMFGRKLVEKQFSLDRMLTATLRVYDACLATYNK
jgi:glycosyltransferase involved in cell wall biosynthesis